MKQPSVQTIIVNYKTPHLTLRAARGAQKAMAGMRGEVTIVDNASRDGSATFLLDAIAADNQPGRVPIRLIASDVNGGFGAGVNIGIAAGLAEGGEADFYYLLNSDAFPAEDALLHLVTSLGAHAEAGIAGSFIHGEDLDVHHTAFRFPGILSEFESAASFGPVSRLLSRSIVPMEPPRREREVPWLAGASMLIRAEVIEVIGAFDETFFLYFEETDLCRRAALAGWTTRYVPQSRVAHVGSASTGMQNWLSKPDYWLDSRLYYYVKSGGWTFGFMCNLGALLGAIVHAGQTALRGRPALGPLRLAMRQFRHMALILTGRRAKTLKTRPKPATAIGRT